MNPRNLPCQSATLLVLLVVLSSRIAAQDLVTFVLSGVVERVDESPKAPLPPPWNTVQPGDAWSIAYTFDPTTHDQDPSESSGLYDSAVTTFTIRAGAAATSGTTGPEAPAALVVQDDPSGIGQYLGAFTWRVGDSTLHQFFNLTDSDGQVIQVSEETDEQ